MPSSVSPDADVVEAQLAMLRAGRLERQREHTLAPSADLVDPPPPEAGIERLIAVSATLPFAHLEDPFGRTLDVDEAMARPVVMERRHEAVFGLERDDVGARVGLALDVRIEAGLDADDNQRALGRVAVDPPFIAALAKQPRRCTASRHEASRAATAFALDIDLVAVAGTIPEGRSPRPRPR